MVKNKLKVMLAILSTISWVGITTAASVEKNNFQVKTNKFFIEKKICALLREHYEGKEDFSRKIWTIYTFIIWYDIYFGE